VAETRGVTPDELRSAAVEALPDAPLLVALGGGADSAVAAWVCSSVPRVRGLFVDHGLDGSPALHTAAEKAAASLGLDFTAVAAPVEDGPNLEARARLARWRAIGDVTLAGEVVVTGHTRDDLAETVLMNLLRGAGARGLAAMAVARRGVARPLLGFDRSEVRSVAEALALPFADDPANLRMDLLRNRVRADLVPRLGADYQPAVRANIAAAAGLLAADDEALEAASVVVPVRSDGEALLLPVAVLITVPRPVAARAVRSALRRLNPPYAGRQDDVHAVLRVARREAEAITLSAGLRSAVEGPYVAIWADEPLVPDPVALTVPATILFGHRRLVTRNGDAGIAPRSTIAVDPAVVERGITFRAAEVGERIDIDGGTKLVRDAMAESGIPRRSRPAWPVLADGARIAAIAAGRVAPWARPVGSRIVEVTLEPS
jgi:tRNA(Ile)-lysidine synthase